MTSSTAPIPTATETVELAPHYAIPIVLVLLALPLSLIQIWGGAILALFGLFLLFQTVSLRLRFTDVALEVYRGETQIRRFPYQEWQNWRIFLVQSSNSVLLPGSEKHSLSADLIRS